MSKDSDELKARLGDQPAEAPEPVQGDLSGIYRGEVEQLEEALNDPVVQHEAAGVLRGLIEEIRLTPADARALKVELYGELCAILALAPGSNDNRARGVSGARFSLVAGIGFEPMTFRL